MRLLASFVLANLTEKASGRCYSDFCRILSSQASKLATSIEKDGVIVLVRISNTTGYGFGIVVAIAVFAGCSSGSLQSQLGSSGAMSQSAPYLGLN